MSQLRARDGEKYGILKEITDALTRGEPVKLSSFGIFVVRQKNKRLGRNPKTGKAVPISARRGRVQGLPNHEDANQRGAAEQQDTDLPGPQFCSGPGPEAAAG